MLSLSPRGILHFSELDGEETMSHSSRWFAVALCSLPVFAAGRPAAAQDADLQDSINKAIDRGVAHLKRLQTPNGTWLGDVGDIGPTALAGWTLLESGVAPDDPAIQKAAAAIRRAMIAEQKTYNLSLGIVFFDRMGDPRDIPFIEILAIRLLAGQGQDGGWTYLMNPAPANAGQDFLAKVLAGRKDGEKKVHARVALPRDASQLSPAAVQTWQMMQTAKPGTRRGDNSNTQFAMLALWVAGRYGLPVRKALARVEGRFRSMELPDGSWPYQAGLPIGAIPPTLKSHGMTCAGLLGLAIGHANDQDRTRKSLLNDQAVLAGFAHLARIMRGTAGPYDKRHFYFLWSLERMAMAYNIKKVDGIDWYIWGARQLVKTQEASGAWSGEFGKAGCDTCFGLLFLKRVNVARDLSRIVNEGIVQGKKTKGRPKVAVPIELLPVISDEPNKVEDKKPARPRESSSRPLRPIQTYIMRAVPLGTPSLGFRDIVTYC
jgi:hypothetical protein